MSDTITDIVQRLRAGQRQVEIAAETGVSQPYVSRINAVVRAATEPGQDMPRGASKRMRDKVRKALLAPEPDPTGPKPATRHGDDVKTAARVLVDRGQSVRDTAQALRVSRASVLRWTKGADDGR